RAGVPSPARDARKLMYAALETKAFPDPGQPVPGGAATRFETMIAQREARLPVSRILGFRAFYGRNFHVCQDVLDPRPETECLIDAALEQPFARVLDLGTGSGAILLTLLAERPDAIGVCTDISEDALDTAIDNPVSVDLSDRFSLIVSDWFDRVTGRFDLIVSNPPYIRASDMDGLQPEVRDHEPRIALTDEGDGLDAYRAITAGVMAHLKPGGRLIVEIGPDQADAVTELFKQAGLQDVSVRPDLDGRDRVVIGRRRGNNGT
ncbi:MAG TPA: peptide chain release factor N(5)-glutamine methyltransferase, partial [Rhodobacteraceae bacterium]|nr:peptide chain release factor N(5)-glutamine methyltransferase [Paracoccaceae bacterium]